MRVLVYGLARSGEAAAARLAERGDEVVRVDRSLGNEGELELLDGVELVVKSPGVPGEARWSRRRAPADRGLVGARVRLEPACTGRDTLCRGHRHQRQVHDLRTARRDVRRRRPDVRVAGNIGTPLSAVQAADWVICEVSSFQLEDVTASAARWRCCSTSSPITSTATAVSRHTARRNCGSSRRAAVPGRARRSRLRRASRFRPTIRFRPSR